MALGWKAVKEPSGARQVCTYTKVYGPETMDGANVKRSRGTLRDTHNIVRTTTITVEGIIRCTAVTLQPPTAVYTC